MNAEKTQSSNAINVVELQQAPFTLQLCDEIASASVARRLGQHLKQSDVVLIDGELAAGKTFFVRALVEGIGTNDQVSSPTYTIANIYETDRLDVLHVDAYRLSSAQEFFELGLDTQLEESICLIEWGKRIESAFEQYLQISISFVEGLDEGRTLEISCTGHRWAPVMIDLKRAFKAT